MILLCSELYVLEVLVRKRVILCFSIFLPFWTLIKDNGKYHKVVFLTDFYL